MTAGNFDARRIALSPRLSERTRSLTYNMWAEKERKRKEKKRKEREREREKEKEKRTPMTG